MRGLDEIIFKASLYPFLIDWKLFQYDRDNKEMLIYFCRWHRDFIDTYMYQLNCTYLFSYLMLKKLKFQSQYQVIFYSYQLKASLIKISIVSELGRVIRFQWKVCFCCQHWGQERQTRFQSCWLYRETLIHQGILSKEIRRF